MSQEDSGRRQAAPASLVFVGVLALVALLIAQRAWLGGASRVDPTPPGETIGAGGLDASKPGTGAAASPGLTMPSLRLLPAGLEDRGWVAEIGVQRWIAGSLSGRILLLPPDEIGLAATATVVVSVRYGPGGRTSTVRIRDLEGGRLRATVDRPGTISSAVVAGTQAYVTGDDGSGGSTDTGVQSISIDDGSVRDVIPAGPAPAEISGPVTRAQLRLDPAGRVLGSGLCAADRCSVDLVDLSSGVRSTPVHNGHGFLVAFAGRVLYFVNDTSTQLDALDAVSGALLWHLEDVQLGGALPSADGSRVTLAYQPTTRTGGPVFTLASADAATGALAVLLRRPADTDVPAFFPGLSGDRFAVISSGGSLGDLLGGVLRNAALTLVDARTGAVQPGTLTLTAP
jgi:hypothetical protein